MEQAVKRVKQAAEVNRLDFGTEQYFDYNNPVKIEEIYAALKSSKNTAPGEDTIHYSMLRNMSDRTFEFLLYIYNRVWAQHEFPSEWRKAILIPFLKPEKDPTSVDSYRPIALTSCLCKILEKIVNSILRYFIEKKELLTAYHYGFRKKRSTVDILAKFETDLQNSYRESKHLVAIFIDISKAYTILHGNAMHCVIFTITELGNHLDIS